MASPEFGFVQLQLEQSSKHAFASAVAVGSNALKVRSSNWNAEHNVPPIVILSIPPRAVWVGMGAALAEFGDGAEHRIQFDATYCLYARVVASVLVAGSATAKLRAQYSADSGGAWAYCDGSTGPSLSLAATGVVASSWVALAAAAKADVLWRIVGIDG